LDASVSESISPFPPLICFSHLRWDFVLQRPQHLMERFSRDRRVFFFEEFIPTDHHLAYLEFHPFANTDVIVVRPRIPHSWDHAERDAGLSRLLDQLLVINRTPRPILWFYTPMMYPMAQHLDAGAVVYDCMDELANFRFAPPDLHQRERLLLQHADLVFTGGYSIFEAKRHLHDNIHAFPSSVDVAHFAKARAAIDEPAEQSLLKRPRLGYYGVVDERIDLDLLRTLAEARPDWSIVMVGPIAKIRQEELPRVANLHYFGQKPYSDLPAYLSGWDAALMPFAINESTRYISPTKTPEYLAGGCPVVSTPIADVKRHYGGMVGVEIADGAPAFIAACENAIELARSKADWLPEVDRVLARASWCETYRRMNALLDECLTRNRPPTRPGRFPKPAVHRSNRNAPYDFLIVGAGFAGSVLAERLAASSNKRVLICDRRPHIGGNAFDYHDEAGLLVHRYGPHIFHTNSEEIIRYLSRFTRWRHYEHRVLACVGDDLLPMPINRTTLNGLYGLDLSDETQAADFLAGQAEPVAKIRTSKDVVVSQVGSHLYRTFFEGYTRKQWGLDPSQLDKSVTARIPTRTTTDDRYFLDTFQAMPLDGYTRMFENILDHERITVELDTDFSDLRDEGLAPRTIYTGPIDAFFDHRFGKLPYRSLAFRHETHDMRRFQPVAVVNYPDEAVPYTRITEYKHLTGQVHPRTSISYEFARPEGDPYYPIPRMENHALYKRYEDLARDSGDVVFAGRLGTYKYYNMDQVVGQALAIHRRLARSAVVVAA
jgi:UDP-galactopyranose mutase